jgi:hypothetical protein
MMLRRHPDIQARRNWIGDPGQLVPEARPTPVFFISTGALLTGIVQQPLRDILPDGVAAIKPDRIDSLDFHKPLAPAA